MMRCICGMIVDHAGASKMHVFALEKFGLKFFFDFSFGFIKGSLVANFRYTNFWVAGQE